MAPVPHQGRLTAWKDDRGCGFIKPNSGGKDVFLHISAVQRAGRRPQVGDMILYESVLESNGKIRATKASIQGIPQRSRGTATSTPTPRSQPTRRSQPRPRQPKRGGSLETLVGIAAIATLALFAVPFARRALWTPSVSSTPPSPVEAITAPTCLIKGNISISSGKKLYHLPGMEDYAGTNIHRDKGEKWFCTETEAIAAGWRKAPR
jgi:cold shock CspA family protein